MKSRQSPPIRHGLLLQEVLVGMVLGATLAGLALQMGGRVWRYCREAAEFAQTSQQTMLVRRAWRDFVHQAPSSLALTAEGAVAGDWSASVGRDELTLTRGNAAPRRLRLPPGMIAAVQCEGAPSEPTRWVLTLAWEGRSAGDIRRDSTRIVACREEPSP